MLALAPKVGRFSVMDKQIMPHDMENLFQPRPREYQGRFNLHWNILVLARGMGDLRYSSEPDAPERPYGKWTRKLHFIFLKKTRTEIREWLYIARLGLPYIPRDVVYLICSWIATK